MWGRNIARNLEQLGCLACIADHDPETAATMADAFGCALRTPAQIIEDAGVDGIIIATPAASHAELAIQSLEAGKPVFVEKPLALNLEQATRIQVAAIAAKKPVMVGHLIRHHPIFQHLLEMVAQGAIGDLRHISATRIAPGRIRKAESVLLDLCPHDLALIGALVDMQMPQEIHCQSISHITKGIDDIVSGQLLFSNGVSAALEANWISPVKLHRLIVTGSKACLIFDDTMAWQDKLMLKPFCIETTDDDVALETGDAQIISVAQGEPLRAEIENFIAAVKGAAEPLTGLEEALYVQRILEEMRIAATTLAESTS